MYGDAFAPGLFCWNSEVGRRLVGIEVAKTLQRQGIPAKLGKEAIERVAASGDGFTIFALVETLTRMSQAVTYAGARTELDQKVSQLLALAA